MHYAVHGTGSKDVLLIHGSSASSAWWHAVRPLLAADLRVITLDLSGHGESDHRDSYSGELWARELLAVLDVTHATAPVVVGHSLGGRVALLASAMQPERFASLILLDSGIWPSAKARERLARRTARPVRLYPTFAEARARFALLPPQPQPPATVLDPVAEYGLRAVPGGWTWKHDTAGFPPLYDEAVERAAAAIAMPVVYVSGELSSVVGPDAVERAAALLPDVRTVMVPGAHHHLPLEAPAECARVIGEVLG